VTFDTVPATGGGFGGTTALGGDELAGALGVDGDELAGALGGCVAALDGVG
jgi:hypothetical protein